jgi:hypothetical protein
MSDEDQGDYEVGFGRPPAHTQFKKGQSGNPSGRPRKKTLAEVVDAALHEPVVVTENGKRKTITKLEAMTKQLVNKGAAGDARVAKMLMDFIRVVEAQAASDDDGKPVLKQDDREAMSSFLDRMKRFTAKEGEQ